MHCSGQRKKSATAAIDNIVNKNKKKQGRRKKGKTDLKVRTARGVAERPTSVTVVVRQGTIKIGKRRMLCFFNRRLEEFMVATAYRRWACF
jgi:hypothetical protein